MGLPGSIRKAGDKGWVLGAPGSAAQVPLLPGGGVLTAADLGRSWPWPLVWWPHIGHVLNEGSMLSSKMCEMQPLSHWLELSLQQGSCTPRNRAELAWSPTLRWGLGLVVGGRERESWVGQGSEEGSRGSFLESL